MLGSHGKLCPSERSLVGLKQSELKVHLSYNSTSATDGDVVVE